jgi:hypothetical protein
MPVVVSNYARVLIEGSIEQPCGTRGLRATRDPPKLCLRPVRVFEHIWVTLSHQNEVSDLVNFARPVKFDTYYLI